MPPLHTIQKTLIDTLLILGLFVFPYYLHRRFVCSLAAIDKGRRPIELLFYAHFTALMAALALCFIAGGVASFRRGSDARWLLAPFALAGLILWKTAIMKARQDRRDRALALQSRVVAKRQIWLQDILIFMLILGTTMTLLANLSDGRNRSETILAFGAMELACQIVASLIAIDICRFHHFEKDPTGRAVFFFATVAFSALPCCIVAEILAWSAWRSALAQAALDAEKRAARVRL